MNESQACFFEDAEFNPTPTIPSRHSLSGCLVRVNYFPQYGIVSRVEDGICTIDPVPVETPIWPTFSGKPIKLGVLEVEARQDLIRNEDGVHEPHVCKQGYWMAVLGLS